MEIGSATISPDSILLRVEVGGALELLRFVLLLDLERKEVMKFQFHLFSISELKNTQGKKLNPKSFPKRGMEEVSAIPTGISIFIITRNI